MPQNKSMGKKAIFEQFSKYVSSGKVKTFKEYGIEFIFGKREGPYIWDVDGKKRLINCHSNGGVFNLGHRNREIIKALQDSLETLDIGNHHFVSKPRAQLAQTIAKLTPGDLQYTIFGASGGEAVDTAIKIARGFTKRKKLISAVGGYHGHTGLALAAGAPKFSTHFLCESSDFIQVPFNDLKALENKLDKDTAGVIMETIPATLGMPIPDGNYYPELKKICKKNGSLLIIDEIQTGLGRTGKMWGIEQYDVVPDIMVTAKGLSGGIYPITATIIRKELESVFHQDPFIHISTAGGGEVGCAVAQKVLDITSSDSFLNHVNDLAEIFKSGVNKLKLKYPELLAEFRQSGMMMGIKTTHLDLGALMTKTCYDAGLLCILSGNDTSVIQFLPALNISRELADEILERLDKAFELAKKQVDEYLDRGKS